MTDKETLFVYRIQQAEETLQEAEKMLAGGFSGRSIVNRAYYSLFYSVLALFIHSDINITTSKHIGIISIFDKEFIRTGKLPKKCSIILHDIFDARQEGDYRELTEIQIEDAALHVENAGKFVNAVKDHINQ